MRDNSGQGKASTNTQDSTLKDTGGRGGTGDRPDDQTEGAAIDPARGEQGGGRRSPSDPGRGDTVDGETSPLDISQA